MAVLAATRDGRLPNVELAVIIASDPQAGIIAKATKAGIGVVVCDPKTYSDKGAFGRAILNVLREHEVNWVGQMGWLPLTPECVIDAFPKRMFNQHPGPLRPGQRDFGGMHGLQVHAAVVEFAQRTGRLEATEVVVHRVTPQFDKGAVLRYERVPILDGDDAELLTRRVLPVEHFNVWKFLQQVVLDRVAEVTFSEADRLVKPEHVEIWRECRANARAAYPNG